MLQDWANFQLKQVHKIVIVGRRPQMPGRLGLFGKRQAVEYLCTNWIDLTDSLHTLAGDDRFLIAALKTQTNKAGKENGKFGAAVSHCASSQPGFLFCCALSWKVLGLTIPDSLPDSVSAAAQDQELRCYKPMCFLLYALCTGTIILDVNGKVQKFALQ